MTWLSVKRRLKRRSTHHTRLSIRHQPCPERASDSSTNTTMRRRMTKQKRSGKHQPATNAQAATAKQAAPEAAAENHHGLRPLTDHARMLGCAAPRVLHQQQTRDGKITNRQLVQTTHLLPGHGRGWHRRNIPEFVLRVESVHEDCTGADQSDRRRSRG